MELQFATVTWPVPALYGIGFVVLLIGFFIGFLDSNIRTSKKITAAEAQAETKIREAEKKLALASGTESNALPDGETLFRLKRENARYALEMDGKNVGKPLSSDDKKRLIELITLLRPWLDPPTAQSSRPAVETIQATPIPASAQPASPRPMPPSITAPIIKPDAEKNIKEMSIVNQIDTVLQAHLSDTPLAKSKIRLQESPEGGVEVIVGNDKFPTVDDVTDPEIKRIIRAAIAEWEAKYTPGI